MGFNPNVSKRQFHFADADELDLPAPASGPTHAKGESIPFAGGNFNVARDLYNVEGQGVEVGPVRFAQGAFITHSAQTVIPGTLSRGQHYSEFNSTPENQLQAGRTYDVSDQIGITEERLSTGASEIYAAAGYAEEGPVPPDRLGSFIREQRSKAKDKRIEEDGGVAGFTMREWNALDDEGMTRRHFE